MHLESGYPNPKQGKLYAMTSANKAAAPSDSAIPAKPAPAAPPGMCALLAAAAVALLLINPVSPVAGNDQQQHADAVT
jgi:hypothetical protein